MRNSILTLLLISNLIFAPAFSQNLDIKTSDAIRIHTYDEIVDYVPGPNGQTFVFLKAYGSGKIVIHLIDENLKLIKRKPLNKIKFGTGEFTFKRAFRLGEKILLIGTVTNSKENTSATVMTYFNTTTFAGEKTCTKIFESKLSQSFFSQGHFYEFDQSPNGKFLGIRLMYSQTTQTGENKFSTRYLEKYFLINENQEIKNCTPESRNETGFNYLFHSILTTDDGFLLIAEKESEKTEIEGEYWKDKKQLLRLASVKSVLKIYKGSFSSSEILNYTVSTGLAEFEINTVKLMAFENQVYITGFISNSREVYRQSLVNENEDETDNEVTFFYFQPIKFNASEILINEKNTVFLDPQLEEKLITNPNLKEEDRGISADEKIQFHFIVPEGKNKFTIVAEKFTKWNWPSYETMKNDSRYKIEKDEKGEIVSFSGPGIIAYNLFTEICILDYQLNDSVLNTNSIPRKYSQTIPYEETVLASDGYSNQLIYITDMQEPVLVFLASSEDNKTNSLYYSNLEGSKKEISFSHKWPSKMIKNNNRCSGLIITQDLQTYTVIKLQNQK